MDKFILDEDGFEDIDEGDIFSGEIVKDLFDFLNSLAEGTIIGEEFAAHSKKIEHFRKHCIGNIDKKSTKTNVYYDFRHLNQYLDYEKYLSEIFERPKAVITSLFDKELILNSMYKLFKGNYTIEFTNACGFKNNRIICIHSFSSDVTKNYDKNNTLDIYIRTRNNKTVTLYPVDSYYFETKFNNILANHSDTDKQFYFNDKTIR